MGFDPVNYAIGKKSSGGGEGENSITEEWDFTSQTPLVGENYGITLTASNMSYGENGAIFNGSSDVIRFDYELYNPFLDIINIEVNVFSSNLKSSNNRRLIADANGNGLVWQGSSQLWGIYEGSSLGWEYSDQDDPDIFSGHIVKIKVSGDRRWSVFKDNTLIMKTRNSVPMSTLTLGSSSSQASCVYSIIRSLKLSVSLK